MSKIPENERCKCKKEKLSEPKKNISSSGNNNIGNFTEIKSSKQFDSIIKGDVLVLAYFYATWCGPCNAMAPIVNIILFIYFLQFAKLSKEINNVKFIKVNGDENEEIIEKWNISSFPTFCLIKKGELIDTKIGRFDETEFKKFIKGK